MLDWLPVLDTALVQVPSRQLAPDVDTVVRHLKMHRFRRLV